MPYTLMKGLAWFALALVIGFATGVTLRSITAKRQIARARNHHVDLAEMERLRGRVANLEAAVAERDRLRVELDECRAAKRTGGVQGLAELPAEAAPGGTVTEATVEEALVPAGDESPPDVSAAAAIVGRSIALDDLKVVEGIGPQIEQLCHGIGITTWRELAGTEVSLLRTMLADAGARFRTHDPGTWPQQAALLADGRWAEWRALADALDGGRVVDAPESG